MNDALAEEADALAAVRAVTERDRECARGIETFLKESGMWDPSDDAAAVPDADDSMQGVVAGDGGGIAAAADGNNDVDVFLGSIGSSGGHHGGGGKRRGVVEELTEEEEKQRLERREREMHQAYLERVARFERQEATRIRNIEQAEKKAADTQLKRVRDREGMGNLLREWDDDVVAARGEEEFYRDRQRWIHKRNPILRREQETDSRDRFAELEERAKAQAEELEATRQERERAERLQREQEAAAKRAQEELERAERVRREREAEAAERQKEVYHAVAAGHGVVVGRIMTMDERRRAIEELVAALPTGLDEICAWDVKWDFLEGGGEVVHNKIKAFVAKKVVETLGEDNPDITDFVMTSISRRKGAKYILDELAGVFPYYWFKLNFKSIVVAVG
ncbi:hypothetical protein HDU82_008306 [Entophlyctis luteolus]|nr:hypothetical protein HDU82_008306 [Entophlyctis luteolus]